MTTSTHHIAIGALTVARDVFEDLLHKWWSLEGCDGEYVLDRPEVQAAHAKVTQALTAVEGKEEIRLMVTLSVDPGVDLKLMEVHLHHLIRDTPASSTFTNGTGGIYHVFISVIDTAIGEDDT